MIMKLEKAKALVGKWRDNNYKAGKTLREMGYSESMALKKPSDPINRALKILAKNEIETIIKSDNPARTLIGIVGMSEDELIGHYRYVIKQDRDLANKLKALIPLLATLGIRWNDEKSTMVIPTLNLTIAGDKNIKSMG